MCRFDWLLREPVFFICSIKPITVLHAPSKCTQWMNKLFLLPWVFFSLTQHIFCKIVHSTVTKLPCMFIHPSTHTKSYHVPDLCQAFFLGGRHTASSKLQVLLLALWNMHSCEWERKYKDIQRIFQKPCGKCNWRLNVNVTLMPKSWILCRLLG